jgi:hypothetical protein
MTIEFALKPFLIDDLFPKIEIIGTLDRSDNLLSIEYQLRGDLTHIEILLPAKLPTRQDRLWEATCFEFFVGIPGDRNYWEFNLAPTGDWNMFQLDDYRQGLRPELAFTSLPLTIDRQANLLSLSVKLDLDRIIPGAQSIEVSVTAVIKPIRGEINYWALTHCGSIADFHLRDSFTIEI